MEQTPHKIKETLALLEEAWLLHLDWDLGKLINEIKYQEVSAQTQIKSFIEKETQPSAFPNGIRDGTKNGFRQVEDDIFPRDEFKEDDSKDPS